MIHGEEIQGVSVCGAIVLPLARAYPCGQGKYLLLPPSPAHTPPCPDFGPQQIPESNPRHEANPALNAEIGIVSQN